MIEQTYPSGRKVKNVIDNNGFLSMVQSRKSENHGYWNYAKNLTYNAAGAVTSMQLGNNRWESTQFNSRLQPTQIALGITPGATNLLKLDYSYGTTQNNGNVLSQTITVPDVGQTDGFIATQAYEYDSLNRLKSAEEVIDSQTSWKQVFTFDRYGNRNFDEANTTFAGFDKLCASGTELCAELRKIMNPSVNQSNNRLSSSDDYVFDTSGNTTEDAQGRTFIYDAENKQIEVRDSQQNIIGQYRYDGDGKRIKKIVPATDEVTVFVYNASGQLVAEYSTEISQTPKVSYTTADHLGSPRILTDENGATISRRDFHPFGEETFTPERTQALGYQPDDVRQKFTGYGRDNEIGMDFAQARYYGYNHGRFASPDPLFFQLRMLIDPQVFNLYVYTRNNPLVLIDPDGMAFRISARGNPDQAMEDIRRLAGNFADRVTFTAVYDDDGNLSYYEVGFELEALDFNTISEGARLIYDLVYDDQVFMGQRGGTLQKRVKQGRRNAGREETVDVEEAGAGNVTRNRPGQSGIYEPADEGVDSIFYWSDEPVFELIGGSAVIDPFSFMVHEAAESYLLAQGIEYNTAHGNYYYVDGRGNFTPQPRHPDNAVARERRIHYELGLTTPRSHYNEMNITSIQRIRRGN
ncbi:MAG: hypothetical protein KF762_07010 [Acidobacteria bacterium]|nr:hypothetical protein [Acidobacteriota bacterium]